MDHKSKSLKNIEEKMQGLDTSSLRYHILESAKSFKISWVELGRSLYTVYKDKMFKEWDYSTFDIYTVKEIGIRKQTAMKLLRSYYFLEKEEPQYLSEQFSEQADPSKVPSYETIDVLRRAKGKKELDSADYAAIKNDIFEKGKDYQQVKKDLTAIIRQREELEPEEALQKRKFATVKRFIGTLKGLKKEAELSKLLPYSLIKEVAELISKIEAEVI